MRIISISKGGGRWRTVYSPSKEERLVLATHMDFLREKQEVVLLNCVHGFRVGRSPITNALPHIGKDWTLSMDIADFFDFVNAEHLKGFLPTKMLAEVKFGGVLHLGAPRQGLPTSPFVANIAASELDRDIIATLALPLAGVVYTRYADDLSFSWSGPRNLHNWLREEITTIVKQHGFVLAKGKTHLQSSRAGRRVICGVAVDHEIHARRSARRLLRAAEYRVKEIQDGRDLMAALAYTNEPKFTSKKKHPIKFLKLAHRQVAGLRAWCSMKIPKEKR